jgi:hypothetical protein
MCRQGEQQLDTDQFLLSNVVKLDCEPSPELCREATSVLPTGYVQRELVRDLLVISLPLMRTNSIQLSTQHEGEKKKVTDRSRSRRGSSDRRCGGSLSPRHRPSCAYRVAANQLCGGLSLLLLRRNVGDEDTALVVGLISGDHALQALNCAVQAARRKAGPQTEIMRAPTCTTTTVQQNIRTAYA